MSQKRMKTMENLDATSWESYGGDYSTLLLSVEEDNKEKVESLLTGERLKNTRLLRFAIRDNNLSVLKILLTHGADVNEKCRHNRVETEGFEGHGRMGPPVYKSALEFAVGIKASTELLQCLVDYGANLNVEGSLGCDYYKDKYSLLHRAVELGDKRIIKWLLEKGLDVNIKPGEPSETLLEYFKNLSPIFIDRKNADYSLEIFGYYEDGRRHFSVLELAFIGNAFEYDFDGTIIDLLLENGAVVEDEIDHYFPLHVAITIGSEMSIIRKLVDAGATVHSVCHSLEYTPLAHAVVSDRIEVVNYLLEKGATLDKRSIDCIFEKYPDITSKDGKMYATLLETGQYIRKPKPADLLEFFLDFGADINALIDRTGKTQLHDAVSHNRTNDVQVLLLHGADPFIKDHHGYTPVGLLSQVFKFENAFSHNYDSLKFPRDNEIKKLSALDYTAYLLVREIIIMKTAGKYVNEDDVTLIKSNFGISYYNGFMKKLEELKRIRVSHLSYYDVLTKTITALVPHMNKKVIDGFNSPKICRKTLHFSDLLKKRIVKVRERKILLKFTEPCFKILFGLENHLPIIVSAHISSYLSSNDMISLWRVFKRPGEDLLRFLNRRT